MTNTVKVDDLIRNGEAKLQTGPFGTQLKASDYASEGVPVINVRNIGYGEVRKDTKLEYLEEKTASKLSVHKLAQGDIVFGRKGAADRHAYIKKEHSGWIQGSDCLRLRINSRRVFPRYLSYYFTTQPHKDWMEALCSFGATMSSLNQDIVRRIIFPAPEYPNQQKIVAILSAYDDLIENNKQRIALLERAAEEIYREWFVRMRFPGWEKAKFVKGVPEGWKIGKYTDFVNVMSGGTPKTDVPHYWGDDIPWFTPRDLKGTYFIFDTERRISEDGLKHCSSKLFPPNTVFITARGTVGNCVMNSVPMAMSQTNYALLGKNKLPQYFVYFLTLGMVDSLKQQATGAVFDTIIVDTFKKQNAIIPSDDILEKFISIVDPMFMQIKDLLLATEKLKKLRDMLLPRLISGKLHLEKLEIRFPPSMTAE